ncbi:MAG: hypothetical protein VYB17_04410, partial [Candidatus Thermoplasmatota archaeon]|nr:hypothetical protein [Candidatus Thermoplasmatota archaeon]
MVRRDHLAIILTVLMLSSGCLGMLDSEGEDTGESVEVSQPPTVRLDELDSFLYNQSVILTGRTLDSSVDVAIIASTANGGITSDATFTSNNRFVLEMGVLPSGTHRIDVIATNEAELVSTIVVYVTVLEPPESPVIISAFPPVVYVEEDEPTIVRAKII